MAASLLGLGLLLGGGPLWGQQPGSAAPATLAPPTLPQANTSVPELPPTVLKFGKDAHGDAPVTTLPPAADAQHLTYTKNAGTTPAVPAQPSPAPVLRFAKDAKLSGQAPLSADPTATAPPPAVPKLTFAKEAKLSGQAPAPVPADSTATVVPPPAVPKLAFDATPSTVSPPLASPTPAANPAVVWEPAQPVAPLPAPPVAQPPLANTAPPIASMNLQAPAGYTPALNEPPPPAVALPAPATYPVAAAPAPLPPAVVTSVATPPATVPSMPPPPVYQRTAAMQREPKEPPSSRLPTEPSDEYQIQLDPPGRQRLFKLESEAAFFERMRQDARQRPTPERIEFPAEPVVSTQQMFAGRYFPPMNEVVEPAYVCYGRLFFEVKNIDRYGWDLGPLTPFVDAGMFYFDVATLPYHMFTDPCRKFECNAGYCLPGDPVPFMLYPPGLSISGLLAETGAIVALPFLMP